MIYDQFIAISIGYLIITYVGMILIKETKTMSLIYSVLFFVAFSMAGFINSFQLLSLNKYPPTNYFIFYGLSVSIFLFFIVSIPKIRSGLKKFTFCIWSSQNSLNIYYWHIIPITIMDAYIPNTSWYVRYIVAIVTTILFTKFQLRYAPSLFHLSSILSQIKKLIK